jgi:hypothetical protein
MASVLAPNTMLPCDAKGDPIRPTPATVGGGGAGGDNADDEDKPKGKTKIAHIDIRVDGPAPRPAESARAAATTQVLTPPSVEPTPRGKAVIGNVGEDGLAGPLPQGKKIATALRKVFAAQRDAVLEQLAGDTLADAEQKLIDRLSAAGKSIDGATQLHAFLRATARQKNETEPQAGRQQAVRAAERLHRPGRLGRPDRRRHAARDRGARRRRRQGGHHAGRRVG